MSVSKSDLVALDFGALQKLKDELAEVMAERRDEAADQYKSELAALREKYRGIARVTVRRRKKRRARDETPEAAANRIDVAATPAS